MGGNPRNDGSADPARPATPSPSGCAAGMRPKSGPGSSMCAGSGRQHHARHPRTPQRRRRAPLPGRAISSVTLMHRPAGRKRPRRSRRCARRRSSSPNETTKRRWAHGGSTHVLVGRRSAESGRSSPTPRSRQCRRRAEAATPSTGNCVSSRGSVTCPSMRSPAPMSRRSSTA